MSNEPNSIPGCLLTVSCLLRALGADWGGEKIYLGSYDLITPYRPFSACQRGRDRMDCIGGLWMTCSINRTMSILAAGCPFLLLGPLGGVIWM